MLRRILATSSLVFIMLLLVTAATAQHPPAPYQVPQPASFNSPGQDYAVGSLPTDIAVGDFNGDGWPDVATANTDGTFSILLNKRDGTFQMANNYPSGLPASCAIRSADLNGDGKPDLIVSDCGGSMNVLLGNGDGTFLAPTTGANGLDAWFQVVGDFNSDGKIDVAGITGHSVVVLLGKGDGSFQAAVYYDIGHNPQQLAVADLNRDGKLDLLVASDDGSVSVLLGNVNGTFQVPVLVTIAGGDSRPDRRAFVAIGDLNGDGIPDFVFSWGLPGSDMTQHQVRLGSGDGLAFEWESCCNWTTNAVEWFPAPAPDPHSGAEYSPASLPWATSVILGDFNGDGLVDRAKGGEEPDSAFEIALGDGTGNFWLLLSPDNSYGGWATLSDGCCDFEGWGSTIHPLAWSGHYEIVIQGLVAADFNGDGKLDIAAARTSPNVVTILLNTTSSFNTNPGANIAAHPVDSTTNMNPVTLSFSSVTQSGMTTLSTSTVGTAPPSGFQLGTPPVYYDLKTTATFSGSVSVCVNYAGTSFNGQTSPRLFHYENGAWVDITTSLDTAHTTICGSATSFSPFILAQPVYAAQVQDPINADGSSVFNAKKGVVPVKFTLALGNVPTCTLPTASIVVIRTSGNTPGTIDESVYENSSDNGSYFRVAGCQYIYNLASKALAAGTYQVQIAIGTSAVGSGTFGLK